MSNPTQRKVKVVGTYNGMTLAEWRKSNERIKWAKRMMEDATFRDMLAVISNLRPKRQDDPAIELGIRMGYDHVLGVMTELANFPELDHTPIPADYGATDNGLQDSR